MGKKESKIFDPLDASIKVIVSFFLAQVCICTTMLIYHLIVPFGKNIHLGFERRILS